jgi:hypothetical protein
MDLVDLQGLARNISYTTHVRTRDMKRFNINAFNINEARSFGILVYDERGDEIVGFSKWVSPKRTRSYPFARIYNTYHLPKKVTIIPVIKDEGIAGDLDRINFITFSWMNLMNVYIVLAWYDEAEINRRRPDKTKITKQRFDADYVQERLSELRHYHQTALHWNTMHFKRDFVRVYSNAVQAYQRISQQLGVPMHSADSHLKELEAFLRGNEFDLARFKAVTLHGSRNAAAREVVTRHALEHTPIGEKTPLRIINQLGGEYFLTVDGVYQESGQVVFQEAKHSSKHSLPSLDDIQDGLFKLILLTNLEQLTANGRVVPFRAELYLSGAFRGRLTLPSTPEQIAAFVSENDLDKQAHLINLLNQEAGANRRLNIILAGRE